jgi:hypothetical protein
MGDATGSYRFERHNLEPYLYLRRDGVRHSPPEGLVKDWRDVLGSLEDAAWGPHVEHRWDRVAVMLLDDERTVLIWNRRNAGCNHEPGHQDHIPSANDYLVIRRDDLAAMIRTALEGIDG